MVQSKETTSCADGRYGNTIASTSQFISVRPWTWTRRKLTYLVKEAMKFSLIPGYHPHGFVSLGALGNFATEGTDFAGAFPGITNTLLTLNANFRMPVYKDFLQALGLASVSRRSCEALLYERQVS